jgi:hypothetical protein
LQCYFASTEAEQIPLRYVELSWSGNFCSFSI